MEENKIKPEDLAPKRQEQQEEVPPVPKNPWWVKIIPHIVILITILNMVYDGGILNVLVFALWVWFGYRIQTDKYIVNRADVILFLVVIMVCIRPAYQNIQQIIQWLSSVWGWVFSL